MRSGTTEHAPADRRISIAYTSLVALLIWSAAIALAPGALKAAEPRYTAQWADGTKLSADKIQGWRSDTRPTLAGRMLLDLARPAHWLRNNSAGAASSPTVFVELQGGDCLPGSVVGFRAGGDAPYDQLPPHLLVEPRVALDLPGMPPRATIRVPVEHVRRVVWKSQPGLHYQPGTLFYLGGRRQTFRAIRWSDSGVRLLAENGSLAVPFADIAEIHLPRSDSWETHLRRLAVLAPMGATSLVRLDTPEGLRLTTSLERLQVRATGETADPDHAFQVVQPVWSLDTFFLKQSQIREWQFFPSNQLPLTWLDPVASTHRAALSSGWQHWRLDANVRGDRLIAAGETFGWGFGVHASHELQFVLPAVAKSFQSRLALDKAAGQGGCARGKVFLSSAPQRPLFQSDLLIGSKRVLNTGPLALPVSTSEPLRLALVADAAVKDRPSSADPLDIRDVFDWLEPCLELQSADLQLAVDRRAATIAAFEDWSFDGDHGIDWRLVNLFDQRDHERPAFRLAILPLNGPLTLSRRLHVEAGRESLAVLIGRREKLATPSEVEVRVNGLRVDTVGVPVWTETSPRRPLLVKLDGYAGRDLEIELEIRPTDERSYIEWQGAALMPPPAAAATAR
ncbi:MAG TPA: NPCBM/NEW2 domain-containing protein [Pirellulales bacterium]|nr:NPCBM/NEW2 domain-containing protein [Pirellulales bacterium]